ncbi:uncharacterized protein LOC130695369 [Daphnia carinata]|uniref:uncharacterized protein LOC130695369 n=1 Tax=Daphnia carinata TaxID=120202 RepID=UPI00257F98BC|nr:uncharacterized protein LOC130695369 [Daphnia carinata]
MILSFSLLAIVFGFCVVPHAAAQEPNSIIPLDTKGIVQNGSTAYYNRTAATLTLRLKMLIRKHNSKTYQLSEIRYRIDLALTRDAQLPNDSRQSNFCANALAKFAGACKGRHLSTTIYAKRADDYEEDVTVVFDHIYSGCYKFKIKCCTKPWSCEDSCGKKDGNYEYHLGQLETHLQNVNVTRMNISMRLAQIDRGAEVEFSVKYFEDSRKILEFKEFDVTIRDYNTNKTIVKATTTSKVVRFPSCNDINVNCSQLRGIPSSHKKKINKCLCLPDGNYTMEINVADSRCNNPKQVCETYLHPCKRFTNRPTQVLIYTGGPNIMPPEHISVSHFSGISSFLVLLLALLSIISLVMLVFFNRNWFSSRRNDQCAHHSQNEPEETVSFSLAGRHGKVMLVYDMTDNSMKEIASSLRMQFIASGISTVYDAGDPGQEEEVVIRGEIHWFNSLLNDPEVKVVVIQSKGVIDCYKELNRIRKSDSIAAQDLQGLLNLLFVLNQLIAIAASSISEDSVYGRIFITTYENFDSSTAINTLTPYRCYKLPEHYHMLLSQLVIHTQNERR